MQRPSHDVKLDVMNLKYGLLFLITAILIFCLSSIPSLSSGFNEGIDQVLRKSAHIIFFAALAFSLWKTLPGPALNGWVKLAVCLSVTVGIAALDEVNQLSIPGRSGNITGFAYDCVGIIIGLAVTRISR